MMQSWNLMDSQTKFMFKLAGHLSMTVGELKQRMSYKELNQWTEYYSHEPFIADRLEKMIAQLTALMAQVNGSTASTIDFTLTSTEDDKKAYENAKLMQDIEQSDFLKAK